MLPTLVNVDNGEQTQRKMPLFFFLITHRAIRFFLLCFVFSVALQLVLKMRRVVKLNYLSISSGEVLIKGVITPLTSPPG